MPTVKCPQCKGARTIDTRHGEGTCGSCGGNGEISYPDGNAAALEQAHAERDEALIALQCLERVIARVGGHHHPPDQATIREAQSVLAKHGRFNTNGARPPVAPPWADDPPPWKRNA